MNHNKILNKVFNEHIIDIFSVYISYYNQDREVSRYDYYINTEFKKVAAVFNRVIEELKLNNEEDKNIYSVRIMKWHFESNEQTKDAVISAFRKDNWNLKLDYTNYFDIKA